MNNMAAIEIAALKQKQVKDNIYAFGSAHEQIDV